MMPLLGRSPLIDHSEFCKQFDLINVKGKVTQSHLISLAQHFLRVTSFKQISRLAQVTIFSYSNLKEIVLKMRCLNRDIAKTLNNSEIVRKSKNYVIRKSALQKNCKFDLNLQYFVKAILPYIDTVKIEYLRADTKCMNCFGHNIFHEICSIVEKLPMRFYS